MNRLTRKLGSLLGIAVVLFAQLAIQAHACPMQFAAMDGPAGVASDATAMYDMSDMGSPALCQMHCENGPQTINDTPQPLASVSVESPFMVTLVVDPAAPLPVMPLTPSLQRKTSPPLAIRHCCFRI